MTETECSSCTLAGKSLAAISKELENQQNVSTSNRTAIRNKGDPMKWLLKSLLESCSS